MSSLKFLGSLTLNFRGVWAAVPATEFFFLAVPVSSAGTPAAEIPSGNRCSVSAATDVVARQEIHLRAG